jgi:CDP-6-deoxy-D-xylo-4-hexulose-3-dehydrase
MNYKNLDVELESQLSSTLVKNTSKVIIPGTDYIPVTGKVIEEDDI